MRLVNLIYPNGVHELKEYEITNERVGIHLELCDHFVPLQSL